MKRKHKILITLLAVAVTVSLTTVPAFALTESEVQDQVNAVGKEVVTGNLFVWFLCAIAFLKVSQKIDSFMSSLGINVGHTGGSMLAEAMIAMRGIGTARTFAGRGGSGGSSSGSGGGNTFMKGGLSGVVSRKVTNTAINNANGSKSGGLGGMAFNSSLSKGGGFANSVIGKIATGNISSTGSISGESAADSLMSYMLTCTNVILQATWNATPPTETASRCCSLSFAICPVSSDLTRRCSCKTSAAR